MTVMLAIILSLVALVGRFRRSSGATREQFKWVVWGASIFVLALAVVIAFTGTRYEGLGRGLFMAAITVFLGRDNFRNYRLGEIIKMVIFTKKRSEICRNSIGE